jgi:16S rRNA processing protein RimM
VTTVVVGKIGRAHGIRGEVAVEVRTDDVHGRFGAGSRLATEPARHGPLTVRAARWQHRRLLVCFDGVGDRDAAAALRGALLVADAATGTAATDPEQFWDHQLVGMAAATSDGRPLGTVAEVRHPPGGDLLVVRRDGPGELLVPFVAAIVPVVDVDAGRLVVDPPPGLLET